MKDVIYITNKTDKPMLASIADKFTTNDVLSCELKPGPNAIQVTSLDTGIYIIRLTDQNNEIIYQQKINID
jgi:hypothetical protein